MILPAGCPNFELDSRMCAHREKAWKDGKVLVMCVGPAFGDVWVLLACLFVSFFPMRCKWRSKQFV